MLLYYVIYYIKFRKVMQRKEKEALIYGKSVFLYSSYNDIQANLLRLSLGGFYKKIND